MIQIFPDPGGPIFEKALDACKKITEVGQKVCFQTSFDENKIKRIFNEINYNCCMFYCNSADSIKQADEKVKIVENMCNHFRRIQWR